MAEAAADVRAPKELLGGPCLIGVLAGAIRAASLQGAGLHAAGVRQDGGGGGRPGGLDERIRDGEGAEAGIQKQPPILIGDRMGCVHLHAHRGQGVRIGDFKPPRAPSGLAGVKDQ